MNSIPASRPVLRTGYMFASLILMSVLGIASSAVADEPLPPAADYSARSADGRWTVTGEVMADRTVVGPAEGRSGLTWTIPGYHRHVLVAADGRSALTLPEGLMLLTSNDPGQIAVTLHRPDRSHVAYTLEALVDPASLPRTASNWLWLDDAYVEGNTFALVLVDGQQLTIDAETGEIWQ